MSVRNNEDVKLRKAQKLLHKHKLMLLKADFLSYGLLIINIWYIAA